MESSNIGKVEQVSDKVTSITISFGSIQTRETLRPAGLDSLPIPGDKVQVKGEDNSMESGDIKQPDVKSGEIKIYSRDVSGNQLASVHLKEDGSIEISTTLDIDINGATITALGDVISSRGISLNAHVHSYVNGSTPAITGVPQ
jgi:hypothetical protein